MNMLNYNISSRNCPDTAIKLVDGYRQLEHPFTRYCADRFGSIYQIKANGDHKLMKSRDKNKCRGDKRQILTLTLDYRGPNGEVLRQTQQVAYWMLYAWYGPPKDGEEASHLNGDSSDSSLTNLAWEPPSVNRARLYASGKKSGVNNHKHRFTEQQILFIRCLHDTHFWKTKDIADTYKLKHTTIRRIVKRESYKNVKDDPSYTLTKFDLYDHFRPDYPK